MSKLLSHLRVGWSGFQGGPGETVNHDLTLTSDLGDAHPFSLSTKLAGPGTVQALHEGRIRRVFPARGASEHQANVFPMIEFDGPDLLWRYSPEPSGSNPLQPWMVLVVLPDEPELITEGPSFTSLTCSATELPDPERAHQWAHAVADQDGTGNIIPDEGVCRLIAPRILQADVTYRAVLVPLFERGRLAGLGEDFNDTDVDADLAAWTFGDTANVTLPVYRHWHFTTVPAVDIVQLVARLERTEQALGWRTVRVPDQSGIVFSETDAVRMPGALAVGSETTDVPQTEADLVAATLVKGTDAQGRPVIGPISRGEMFASTNAAVEPWYQSLNHQPVWRAAAGLGEQLVRHMQETYVVESLGTFEVVRHARDAERVRLNNTLLTRKVSGQKTSPAWAELLSSAKINGLNPPPTPPIQPVATYTATPAIVFRGHVRRRRRLPWRRRRRWLHRKRWRAFHWWRHAPHLLAPKPFLARRTTDTISDAQSAALEIELSWWSIRAFDAVKTAQTTALTEAHGSEAPTVTSIERALFEDLLRTNPEAGLPGLTGLPAERVALLTEQPAFVEAFLVGANEEFRRELQWRELPFSDDPQALFFWSTDSPDPNNPDDPPVPDLTPGEFNDATLGSHVASRSRSWMLVKGTLVQEIPDVAVWAFPKAPGSDNPSATGDFVRPIEEIVVDDQTLLVAFDIPPVAPGDPPPEYHFIFAEPIEAERFYVNLDIDGDPEANSGVATPTAADRYYNATNVSDTGQSVALATRKDPREVWVDAARFSP